MVTGGNETSFWRNVSFALVIGMLLVSCQNSSEQHEKWADKQFHDVTYRVPPSWVEIRDSDSVQYRRKETQMNEISLQRYEAGETLSDTGLTVDPSRDIWAYAQEEYESLKRKPENVRTKRKQQKRFPALGDSAYLMRVRTMDGNGISQQRWIIGAMIDEYYYRITLTAERFGHLPAIREAFATFKKSLGTKAKQSDHQKK